MVMRSARASDGLKQWSLQTRDRTEAGLCQRPYSNLGWAYKQSRTYSAAIEPLKKAIQLKPSLPEGHIQHRHQLQPPEAEPGGAHRVAKLRFQPKT